MKRGTPRVKRFSTECSMTQTVTAQTEWSRIWIENFPILRLLKKRPCLCWTVYKYATCVEIWWNCRYLRFPVNGQSCRWQIVCHLSYHPHDIVLKS